MNLHKGGIFFPCFPKFMIFLMSKLVLIFNVQTWATKLQTATMKAVLDFALSKMEWPSF